MPVSAPLTVSLLLLLGFRAPPGPAVQERELHTRTGSCSQHKNELRRISEDGDAVSAPWPSLSWHWLYSYKAGSHRQQKQNSAQGRLSHNLTVSDRLASFKENLNLMFRLKKDSEPGSLFSSYSVASWANETHYIHASMLKMLWLQRTTSAVY